MSATRRTGALLPLGLAIVRGPSMQPGLRDGDRLLVWHGRRPRVGALALVRLPDGPGGPRPVAVKRVTGREDDSAWWVESDNLGVGVDSWVVGALPEAAVIGAVLCRLPRFSGR